MSTEKQRRIYSGRLLSVGLLGGSPEWTATLRQHPGAAGAIAAALAVCACVPHAGFPALGVAALLCGTVYADCEPLELLLLPETGAARLLVRKTCTAWRNYFLLATPFALLTVAAYPRSAWMAAAWIPFAALLLCYFVVEKYTRYKPDGMPRRPLAAKLGAAGFLVPLLSPLTLGLMVSYAFRAERNLNRYLHDYD
ncbi:hypothetical protein [Alistipes sp.]|uniref:hypothetical protein n=1 Tax=Alistipes sp. TaxID=1872444 RepID=UPI0025B9B0FE|nr:hypothetical protein [Alistipes sp.]